VNRLILSLMALLLAVPVLGQTIDFRTDTKTPPAAVDDVGDVAAASNYETTLAEVRKAIQDDEDIGAFRKRLLLRKLNRPSVALQVTDYVTSGALDAGVIEIPPPAAWAVSEDGDVIEPAINLDALIAFIERILPLILQLISLFGGWMLVSSNGITSLWERVGERLKL